MTEAPEKGAMVIYLSRNGGPWEIRSFMNRLLAEWIPGLIQTVEPGTYRWRFEFPRDYNIPGSRKIAETQEGEVNAVAGELYEITVPIVPIEEE